MLIYIIALNELQKNAAIIFIHVKINLKKLKHLILLQLKYTT